jgi:hypothetical protein
VEGFKAGFGGDDLDHQLASPFSSVALKGRSFIISTMRAAVGESAVGRMPDERIYFVMTASAAAGMGRRLPFSVAWIAGSRTLGRVLY